MKKEKHKSETQAILEGFKQYQDQHPDAFEDNQSEQASDKTAINVPQWFCDWLEQLRFFFGKDYLNKADWLLDENNQALIKRGLATDDETKQLLNFKINSPAHQYYVLWHREQLRQVLSQKYFPIPTRFVIEEPLSHDKVLFVANDGKDMLWENIGNRNHGFLATGWHCFLSEQEVQRIKHEVPGLNVYNCLTELELYMYSHRFSY